MQFLGTLFDLSLPRSFLWLSDGLSPIHRRRIRKRPVACTRYRPDWLGY